MEGNFVNELGLVVLDLVELFCCHFRVNIALIFFQSSIVQI
jgi:hypothetical protein